MRKTGSSVITTAENSSDTARQWFAIRVKSRYEKMVATIARNKGFDEFLPLYQSRRRWSDGEKCLDLPLFPGYLFCRLDPLHRMPLLTIPGVLHFVGVGKTLAAIDALEMSAIQMACRSGVVTEPWTYLEVGQRVRLEAGPLAGLEGILVSTSKQQRLIVSVTLLRRSVAVSIERSWVRPLESKRSASMAIDDPAVEYTWV